MSNVLLSLRLLGEDGVTRDGVVRGGSNYARSLHSRGGYEASSSHK